MYETNVILTNLLIIWMIYYDYVLRHVLDQ